MPRRTARLAALPLLIAVACGFRATGGRTGDRTGSLPAVAPARIETQLFCGRTRPDGGVVTDQEWQGFLAEVVTPRFPGGFTVLEAAGAYRDADARETVHERTEVLVIVHEGDPASSAAIQEIVRTYRARFDQRTVLRVDVPVAAWF